MAKWSRRNNCYGYATNTPKWLLLDGSYSKAVYELLDKNPNWKLVKRSEMVLGKEYVAFRYGKEDFHFMRRNKQGYWRHKQGPMPVQAISTKDVFAKSWDPDGFNYNSKIYLFEVA